MSDFREIERFLERWFEREGVEVSTAGGEIYAGVAQTTVVTVAGQTPGTTARIVQVLDEPEIEIVSLSDLARALADAKVMA